MLNKKTLYLFIAIAFFIFGFYMVQGIFDRESKNNLSKKENVLSYDMKEEKKGDIHAGDFAKEDINNNGVEEVEADPHKSVEKNKQIEENENEVKEKEEEKEKENQDFYPPLKNYQERVTKKPFGIYITPATSPVTPEKFNGYHTGVDFEILEGEKEAAVEIASICGGEVLFKGEIGGYGGVFIQSCSYQEEAITVLYGHLDLASISLARGDTIGAGEQIGVLGKGNSEETDFERKHLHLGVKRGVNIDYRGYVGKEDELSGWFDPMELIES